MKEFVTLVTTVLIWPAIIVNLDKGFDHLTATADVMRGYWAAEYQLQRGALLEALQCNIKGAASYLRRMAPSASGDITRALGELEDGLPVEPDYPQVHSSLMWLSTVSYQQDNPDLPALYPNWYYRFAGGVAGG